MKLLLIDKIEYFFKNIHYFTIPFFILAVIILFVSFEINYSNQKAKKLNVIVESVVYFHEKGCKHAKIRYNGGEEYTVSCAGDSIFTFDSVVKYKNSFKIYVYRAGKLSGTFE